MPTGKGWMKNAVLASMALVLTGCGGGASTTTSNVDYAKVRAMSAFYERFMNEHRSQPPKDEQEYRDFLASKASELEGAGLSVDEMFASPRGGPITWVYGRLPASSHAGMTYIAYETTPVDGKRLAIAMRGMFEEMDETKFKTAFPAAN